MFDFSVRMSRFQRMLGPGNAVWISKREEVFYLTGFTGEDTALVVMADEVFFVTDRRYTEQIRYEVKSSYQISLIEGGRGRKECLLQIVRDKGIDCLLVEKSVFPLSLYEYLAQEAKELRFEETKLLKELRMVKDETEIEIIRQNLMITEWGYYAILRQTRAGKRETELSAELEYFLKKKGAKSYSFEPIVASGHRTTLPHGAASDKAIEKGDVVMFDFGIMKNGYCSDFTRCFSPVKIKRQKVYEIRQIVEDALRAAEAAVKPGVTAESVHVAAYKVIEEAGYAQSFWHSTGHGVGVEIHEEPYLRFGNSQALQEGMVFTVEPGIYLPEEGFGIRLEDMVVVRKNGAEVLTQAEYEL